MIEKALTSKENKWLWGLITVMSKGYNNPKKGENKSAPTGPSGPPSGPGPQNDRTSSHAAAITAAA